MRRLGGRSAVVAGNERDEQLIAASQSEQFAVLDQIHRVLVVAGRVDVQADLVQQRGDVQQQAGASIELMLLSQLLEQLFGEQRDVLGVVFVEAKLAAKIEPRSE